ncbi:pyridoxamine 5'-phosphate oxidase family protein [Pseudonocardia xinjiangensis]|uniref:pyridoxamine 5'-phosphate oxidase family protein n=1 Tax=Pseudonocardia xinjiangensis TaxID=75289 RepID=UPI003D8B230E
MSWVFEGVGADFETFWTERRYCLLATVAGDGTPHLVAVGVTVDLGGGLARVIARRGSQKIRNVLEVGEGGARVAVTGIEGARWSTLQGLGIVRSDAASVAEAERRYAQRYGTLQPHPERVVLEIAVERLLGSVQ